MSDFFAISIVLGALALFVVGWFHFRLTGDSKLFKRALLGYLLLAGAAFFSVQFAHTAGNQAGERSIQRLSLIWPNIVSMSANDRALLAGLSMTCHMDNRPAVRSAVIACLQEAAADPKATFPKGVDQPKAQARLNELLRQQAS